MEKVITRRVFSDTEQMESSTFRELTAFADFYCSEKASEFKNTDVLHLTDSQNCEKILLVGSKNPKLHPLVFKIFTKCKALNIRLKVQYISRSDPRIQVADMGSRQFDLTDFSIDFDSFILISRFWGPFELDCFATKLNKKCTNYISKFEDANAFGVNFFAQNLPDVKLWVTPPPNLVIPAILHLQLNFAQGCLVVPAWPSSNFWSYICADGRHFNDYIVEIYKFKPVYVSGSDVMSNVFKGVKPFYTLVLKFDFSSYPNSAINVSSKIKNRCFIGGCFDCE